MPGRLHRGIDRIREDHACIYPRLHSLCVNEAGIPAKGRPPPPAGSLAVQGRLRAEEPARPRWSVPPWGGLIIGEKGNEWEAMSELLRCHGRQQDLRVLRTRPLLGAQGWLPPVRLNLIGSASIPADTYARLLVEASLAVEETDRPDDFFIPQARDKIAWGIRLLREAPSEIAAVALPRLLEILTSRAGFEGLAGLVGVDSPARRHLEIHHWSQPPDQLGGLISTIYNILIPYSHPEIAEVFCEDSTVTLDELEEGRVLCLALPQRLAVQRRYVATVLKGMVYQLILQRFDRGGEAPRNVIVIEQDEWQRHAVRADCDVDLIREAQGTTYAASQTQDAVWSRFRSREAAAPLIANLRNRWICQAGTDACAEESTRLLGERTATSISRTRGGGGSTRTVTAKEEPVMAKSELRSLPPFHVVFAPAEGRWLYVKVIAMPVLPSGGIPPWWFGNWHPWHWLVHLLRLPHSPEGYDRESFLPPWRAQAPWRAQFRWLLGLEGTYIVLKKLSRSQAARGARPAQ